MNRRDFAMVRYLMGMYEDAKRSSDELNKSKNRLIKILEKQIK